MPQPILTQPGLSNEEAADRLRTQGPNEIVPAGQRGLGQIVRSVATEPMFLLLLVAASVYLVLGDLGEGLLLAGFALATVALVVWQERRSEQALRALREMGAPQARVLRGGQVQRIPARELVTDELVLVSEGERVPADAVLLETTGLSVDESLLTGEAVPVHKRPAAPDEALQSLRPGGDGSPLVFAGTLVVAGHGLALVVATGAATQVGRIGGALAAIDQVATPLQQELGRLVRAAGLLAGALALLLVVWWGWQRGDWLQGLLAGLAFAMAMLPEEFPMVLAVFLALGAWRLAGVKVLARRPAVVEALGSASVLCVDKTGTLTENRMRLRLLVTADGTTLDLTGAPALPEPLHPLLEAAVLASRRGATDPMDRAVVALAEASAGMAEHLHPDWLLDQETPPTPQRMAMSQVWRGPDGGLHVAAKGAPEAIAGLCGFDAAQRADLQGRVEALAARGLRVLAVAQGHATGDAPALQAGDGDFTWLGLLGFEDPLRPSVPAAVARAARAGITVAMITGDHPATALAIAAQAGIDTSAGALTGEQLAALDDAALREAVGRVRVFARVMPQQKLRLVQALQSRGEVVAMTGDGVNDAPALKAAHIGIAMGVRGTDVAREAAGVVLLDEDFSRIVDAVRTGRRIQSNLRRAMTYVVAVHVPIAGLALLPVLAGLPPLLLPAHVVLTEMVIDPVCSLAFEGAPEAPGAMERPPRPLDERLIGWPLLLQGLGQGAGLLVVTLAAWAAGLHAGLAEDAARSLALVSLTAGNLGLVWINATAGRLDPRAFGSGLRAFGAVTVGAVAVLAAALLLPGPGALLRMAMPPPGALALALGGALAAVALGAVAARRLR